MLSIRNLSKTYANGVEALRDVSLEIPRGMFGLLGPNGAGKSTLFNLLAGADQADKGRVELIGVDMTGVGATTRARAGVTRTWQGVRLLEDRSVLDNVAVGYAEHIGQSMVSAIFRGSLRTARVKARAALDDALRYAQERESFGKPIWRHQSVGNHLANMATQYTAARQLVLLAADRYDSGGRCDMEAGMAKLFASEAAMQIALDAVRVHGGYGYSTEFDVERYFRDAPLMIVGEGTNEIQRNVITSQLVARGGITT